MSTPAQDYSSYILDQGDPFPVPWPKFVALGVKQGVYSFYKFTGMDEDRVLYQRADGPEDEVIITTSRAATLRALTEMYETARGPNEPA